MTGLVEKIKDSVGGGHKDKTASSDEQSFTIQPHPATSNNPADLQPKGGPGSGLSSNPEAQAHHAREPHVLSPEVANNIEQPASREELAARSASLNA